jgi:cytochrome P450
VVQDPAGFRNGGPGVRIPHVPVEQPPLLPIDSNPPVHRQLRQAIKPYLSPQAVSAKEPEFRQIIGDLLVGLLPLGQCDMARSFTKVFPAQITLQVLLGVDDPDDLARVRKWVRRLSYDLFKTDPADLARDQKEWLAWGMALVEKRRAGPDKDDLVGALLRVRVEDGRLLTDLEIAGTIQNLTMGGFSTTSDAACSIVIRLIEEPALESALRANPNLIDRAVEEILRLEPPVTSRPRLCASDTIIGRQMIPAGDRVLCNYVAANLDPEQFDAPDRFDLTRRQHRPLTFGAGPHRCVGSNVARQSLRIVLQELLAKMTDIRYADGEREERVSFNAAAWRAVDRLPVTFRPLD